MRISRTAAVALIVPVQETRRRWHLFFRHADGWDLRRAGLSCLATLQIVASAGLGPADAILDIERFGAPLHVESPEGSDCGVGHGHLFCQVVRSLSKAGVPTGITLHQITEPPLRPPEPDRGMEQVAVAPILLGSSTPRAPPIA